MNPFTQIIYAVEDHIALITLNRPEKLNAWTIVMMQELIDAFDLADKDDKVRVVIVTGAGRAFCAGADLDPDQFGSGRPKATTGDVPRDTAGRLTLKIIECKKPVIAAINGPAVGVGLTMTLAMDIRYASETAKMGLVFNRRGMAPEGCCTWLLPRLIGFSQAAEWIYTGRVFSAQEAKEGGVIGKLFPPEELLEKAYELAREIAENTSPVSTALSRQMLWTMMGVDHPMEAHQIESKCLNYMMHSPDFAEGVASFLEKRPPEFAMSPEKDLPDFYPWWTERSYDED